ncbi:hypothetical protein CTAM01_07434 [Colletotrichum tamarilloi]|uniref:Uncharacterized protein n=1 Tax=Colletotrichum tamarilloi TaxID=1209934 RepID=A0ABQ9R8Q7_9PEZI|nr:uncharacterized protein CTAM01_07434 [Colletotrichum tamarilloi]KAK1498216.1 hypothetical protein CTAM01_07434 [Colletotrichum tamarilloi]
MPVFPSHSHVSSVRPEYFLDFTCLWQPLANLDGRTPLPSQVICRTKPMPHQANAAGKEAFLPSGEGRRNFSCSIMGRDSCLPYPKGGVFDNGDGDGTGSDG